MEVLHEKLNKINDIDISEPDFDIYNDDEKGIVFTSDSILTPPGSDKYVNVVLETYGLEDVINPRTGHISTGSFLKPNWWDIHYIDNFDELSEDEVISFLNIDKETLSEIKSELIKEAIPGLEAAALKYVEKHDIKND